MSELTQSFFELADGTRVASYLREGMHLPPKAVEEYIVLRIGPIAKGDNKIVNLDFLQGPARPVSLYALRGSTSTDDTVDFNILYQNQLLGRLPLSKNDVPYSFRPLVVTPELQIQINPKYEMLLTIIYFTPVALIQTVDVGFE